MSGNAEPWSVRAVKWFVTVSGLSVLYVLAWVCSGLLLLLVGLAVAMVASLWPAAGAATRMITGWLFTALWPMSGLLIGFAAARIWRFSEGSGILIAVSAQSIISDRLHSIAPSLNSLIAPEPVTSIAFVLGVIACPVGVFIGHTTGKKHNGVEPQPGSEPGPSHVG